MKIFIISPKNKTVFNFRGDLIRDMIAHGHEVVVSGPNRDFLDEIMSLGVSEFIEIPLVKDNTNIKGDLQYLRNLKQAIKKQKPELVFSYTIKPVVYGSIAARAQKVPHIYAMVTGLGRVYAGNGIKTRILRMITNILYKRAFKACDKVIFQNGDDIKELVGQKYLPAEKAVKVDGSGVNMNRFIRAALPDKPVFLMVSRIIREKGIMEFCMAAQTVKKKHHEARFILLGGFDTSIGALTPADIQPFVNDGSIELPGEVNDPVQFYAQSSVFVLPSYYREGLPRTILEAMACGRPVITTDWPGCREAVCDGKTGLLVPPRDAETLAKQMLWLLEHREEQVAMAQEAFTLCAEKYSVDVVNREMRHFLGY